MPTQNSASAKKLQNLVAASTSTDTTGDVANVPLSPPQITTRRAGNSSSSNVEVEKNPSSFLLMDLDILESIIDLIGKCPVCNGNSIQLDCNFESKKGLSIPLTLRCEFCLWEKLLFTSKKVSSDGAGDNPFEVNLRSMIAMREIGKGHTALNTFCGYMRHRAQRVATRCVQERRIAGASTT